MMPRTLPERLVTTGQIFYGLGLVAFGIEQFIYGEFIPGRAPPWPSSMPGRLAWAYGTGVLLVVAGAAMVSGRRVREGGLLAGALIVLGSLLRHLPLVASDPHGIVLTNAGKALALFGGALAVAAAGSRPTKAAAFPGSVIGRFCLGAFMILAGIQHFLFAGFVQTLVPAWIPGPLFWTYLAGVALIAGGAGLLLPRTVRLAAVLSGLMIFLWVLLLHVPRALAATPGQVKNEWTALFEALAMSGIAWVISGSSPPNPGRPRH